MFIYLLTVLHGLVVRIPGFHPGGPGSIPGVGNFFVDTFDLEIYQEKLRNSVWFINLRCLYIQEI